MKTSMTLPRIITRLLVILSLALAILLAPILVQPAHAAYSWGKPVWATHYISQYFHPPVHKGVDIAVASGNYAHSITHGTVIYAGWDRYGFGWLVVVRDWNGSYAFYAHNRSTLVRVGWVVSTGQRLAVTDSTGYSTGPHVHLQMYSGAIRITNVENYLPTSTLVNPYTYLLARGVRI